MHGQNHITPDTLLANKHAALNSLTNIKVVAQKLCKFLH